MAQSASKQQSRQRTSTNRSRGPWAAIAQSFKGSVTDIIYGMEDGTVSIFGLVAGVALSANSPKPVLLAGASGAVAAAISMMAGDFLQKQSQKQSIQSKKQHERSEVKEHPQQEQQEIVQYLRGHGFSKQDTDTVMSGLQHDRTLMLKFQDVLEINGPLTMKVSPLAHSIWMFISDIIAAFTPVIPFALFSLGLARVISVVAATIILIILGVGRGIVGHRNILITTLETLGIGLGAALGGIIISKLLQGGL